MEASSPAKLYATLVGAALTIAGIVGFFYSASFGSPGSVDDAFGILAINGWHNVSTWPPACSAWRPRATPRDSTRWASACSTSWWRSGDSSSAAATTILGIVPVNTEDNILHLILGLTGLAAGAATSRTSRAATKSR